MKKLFFTSCYYCTMMGIESQCLQRTLHRALAPLSLQDLAGPHTGRSFFIAPPPAVCYDKKEICKQGMREWLDLVVCAAPPACARWLRCCICWRARYCTPLSAACWGWCSPAPAWRGRWASATRCWPYCRSSSAWGPFCCRCGGCCVSAACSGATCAFCCRRRGARRSACRCFWGPPTPPTWPARCWPACWGPKPPTPACPAAAPNCFCSLWRCACCPP